MWSWSPSGDAVDYRQEVNGAVNVWRLPLGGREPRRLTSFADAELIDFAWSADGRQLFYVRLKAVSKDVVLITDFR